MFRIVDGSVDLYLQRFIVAISGIASKYLHWPSRSEKTEIVAEHTVTPKTVSMF